MGGRAKSDYRNNVDRGLSFHDRVSECRKFGRVVLRVTECDVSDQQEIKPRDLQTLAGIVRGPGFYASPSPDRIKRLLENRLIKKQRGTLRPTWKGRMVTLKGRLIAIFSP